jgi:hypothetical protein
MRPEAVREGISTGVLGTAEGITVCLKTMRLYRIQRSKVDRRRMSVPALQQKTKRHFSALSLSFSILFNLLLTGFIYFDYFYFYFYFYCF